MVKKFANIFSGILILLTLNTTFSSVFGVNIFSPESETQSSASVNIEEEHSEHFLLPEPDFFFLDENFYTNLTFSLVSLKKCAYLFEIFIPPDDFL